jgi:hypothetical protein
MYKCAFCGVSSEPCARLNRVVTGYRKRDYHNDNRVSLGYEIVAEANVCSTCGMKHAASPPVYGEAEVPVATPSSQWKDSVPAISEDA